MQALVFQPRDRRELKKLINNLYVKNIPKGTTEKEVRNLFSGFGNLKSVVLMENEIGQFGFVCFDDPQGISKEYGPECAAKAIQALNGTDLGENKLYLRHAMKKADREADKKKEALKYKNSKKRCNLYVKNFPPSWGEP